MKKKVCSILLAIAVLFTAADFPMLAGAAEENGAAEEYAGTVEETGKIPETPAENRVTVAVIQDDAEKITAGKTQSAHVAAKNIGDSDAVLRVYLTNADGTAPDMEIEVPNLCTEDVNLQSEGDDITEEDITRSTIAETMKGALILADGSTADLTAEWKETRDDNNTVTEHFLEAALPAGASTRFDMQLLYRTDEEIYTRTTLVRAKAFVDGQEVTEASDEEDEDNEAEFTWEAAAEAGGESEAEDEAGEENVEETTETEGVTAKRVMRAANGGATLADENVYTVYFIPSQAWEFRVVNEKYVLKGNMSSGTQGTISWNLVTLVDTGTTVESRKVYRAEFDKNVIKHSGAGALQFWLCSPSDTGNQHSGGLIEVFSGWNEESAFQNKLYIDGGGWKEYTPDIISYAGEKLNFVDLTSELDLSYISAEFQTKNGESTTSVEVSDEIIVPDDVESGAYTQIRFKIGESYTVAYSLSNLIDAGNTTFYYGSTTISGENIISAWGEPVSDNESLVGKILYFNSDAFGSDVKVSCNESEENAGFVEGSNVLAYTFLEDSNATQQSIITVTAKGNTYRFLWGNTAKNQVVLNEDVATVSDIYRSSYTVYFDASLSKLSYSGDAGAVEGGNVGIPDSGEKIFYHAYNDDSTATEDGELQKNSSYSEGENKWQDVYSAELKQEYTHIIFYTSNNLGTWPGENSPRRTENLTIDWSLAKPCFYADSSDDIAYDGGKARSGYWDEVYSIRNAECGKEADVVDIDNSERFVKEQDTMYVNTTFYDYYTDYELNGNNRDTYKNDFSTKDNDFNSQRNWVTFRQFNQALSDYYEENKVAIPIYTGHFQTDGTNVAYPFSQIANTLKLFGGDKYNLFFSTNNSVIDNNGNTTDSNENPFYDYAAQGLVAQSLTEEGKLQTSNRETFEPHFDEDFLLGENSKNAVLGEVYKNVSFPFTKEDLHDNGVEYWVFDSNKTTLEMKQDPDTDEYYLKKIAQEDQYQNLNSGSNGYGINTENKYGFFPFNSGSTNGQAGTYNYGFGTKIEFNFRLTEDGKVLDSKGNPVDITFEFSGDDDVWVFIDDQLALDVGGAHGKVTGTLNFSQEGNNDSDTTQIKATVSNVKSSAGFTPGSTTNTVKTTTLDSKPGEIHTLTMYYMERGMWESNMKITFNFPDENQLEVKKEVDTTNVNTEIFPEELFTTADFGFTIKNAVTHWGETKVSDNNAVEDKVFNESFQEDTVEPSETDNTFELVTSYQGKTDVVHWKALHEDDASGTYKEKRWGIVYPSSGKGAVFDALGAAAYLSFDFYFDYDAVPSLSNAWIELEDADGTKIGARLSASNTFGSGNLKQKTWQNIKVRLDKLTTQNDGNTAGFDWEKVKNIKLAFTKSRDIYFDNFTFVPETSMDVMTGFTLQQADIPDYGSVEANGANENNPSLQNATGAVYTLTGSDNTKSYGRIGTDGMFTLRDGETATFSNQFRLGSYIYLEETGVNSEAFDTTWTIYDNGVPVTSMSSGDTINVGDESKNLVDVKGTALEDGRIEKTDENSPAANYGKGEEVNDTEENSIVFRSYTNPDNRANQTKLKAVFTNTVKTRSLVIKKDKSDTSGDLGSNTEYEFKITFTNVAGSSLGDGTPIEHTVKVKAGESVTIEGIPIGTDYVIEEVEPADGSRLESIEINTGSLSDEEKEEALKWVRVEGETVHGIMKDNTVDCSFVFKNTNRPLLDITVEKKWQDASGEDISDSISAPIYVQLQRNYVNGNADQFEPVMINGKNYVTIEKGYEGWRYTFTGLEKYRSSDLTGDPAQLVKYTYRVVEGTLDGDGNFVEAENGKITVSEIEYGVDYEYKEIQAEDSDAQYGTATNEGVTGDSDMHSEEHLAAITNTRVFDLQIKKVDASETDKTLDNVEFTLEKGTLSDEGFIVDSSFAKQTLTTQNGGIATVQNLSPGIYRIIETKTQEKYSLLKSPLFLNVDGKGSMKIQDGTDGKPQNVTLENNTIKITISNRLQFELPVTGGYLRFYMIAGGLALAGTALFIYRLQKRRKEVKTPGKK